MQPNPKPPLSQRKGPVHMPPVPRHNEPVLLFVTIGLQPRMPALANASFRDAFRLACADADAWSVGRYVIMPDHVHLFCQPAREPMVGIKRWSGYLKERVTKHLKVILAYGGSGSAQPRPPDSAVEGEPAASRSDEVMEGEPAASRSEGGIAGRVSPRTGDEAVRDLPWHWQADCWDTQLRSAEHYHERWEYVRQNPLRKGLVTRVEDWPWQGELHVLRW